MDNLFVFTKFDIVCVLLIVAYWIGLFVWHQVLPRYRKIQKLERIYTPSVRLPISTAGRRCEAVFEPAPWSPPYIYAGMFEDEFTESSDKPLLDAMTCNCYAEVPGFDPDCRTHGRSGPPKADGFYNDPNHFI